jgi:tetratricopeptide (TPR) repeat protein
MGDRRNEAMVQSNMSLFSHHLGNQSAAFAYSQVALAASKELQDTHLQGEALTYQAHALVATGVFDEATESYQQAYHLRQELGELPHAMEALAGLAHCSLAQGHYTQAQAQIEEILSFLSTDSLDGAEEPLRVYLTCYRVLDASHDDRAGAVLQTAYKLLTDYASQISDERARRLFLEEVAVHHDIIEYYNGVFDVEASTQRTVEDSGD